MEVVEFFINSQSRVIKHRTKHGFQELDYMQIYAGMMKPAYIFDGRKILDHDRLQRIGFVVQTIGKRLARFAISRAWGSQTQI